MHHNCEDAHSQVLGNQTQRQMYGRLKLPMIQSIIILYK